MAANDSFDRRDRPHISIDVYRESAGYSYPSRKQERKPLRGDYRAHAAQLIEQLEAALGTDPAAAETRLPVPGLKPGSVIQVATLPPDEGSRIKVRKVPQALEFPPQDVTILRTERNEDRSESALLFVPDDARDFLRGRIRDYGRDPGNRPRPDVERFEVIEEVRTPSAEALFSGDVDLSSPERVWWELWARQLVHQVDWMTAAARRAEIEVHHDRLIFPDTTVLFFHATAASIADFAATIPGAITEIRRATGTIELFLDQNATGINQDDWVTDLVSRVDGPPLESPVVCILDTGISAAHPLIAPALRGAWAYNSLWGADDHASDGGHGTRLAGLVLYGDLEPLLNDTRRIVLTHGAESMKLLPPHGFQPTDPPSYGVVTQGAVSSVEIERSGALRSFCIAVSTNEFPASRPSSWSGAIDQIASGAMPGEINDDTPAAQRQKRLIVVATGNVSGGRMVDVLPSQQLEDPSQSWNAVAIGGFTRKEQPPAPPPVLKPVVPANHRSPFSLGSTSLPDDLTPIKPEVLFEAGNMLADASGFCGCDPSVSLLSTGSDVLTEPLVPFWATSAAAGMAGHFVGKLQAALPDLWPETHRALMVDSAQWPGPIRKKFVGRGAHWKSGSKAEKQKLLREFGYGVPDIDRAVHSARNDATLVAQAEIQPYAISGDGRTGVFNEMHFYDLPWPNSTLERLENEIVTMKVTLSYFIEPNLTGKAATRPDSYRSFGLRFEMKKRGESAAHFRHRVSASQEHDGSEHNGEASYWLLGPKAIQAGSLHCDLWRGHAIDLAGHDAIAVYPVGGWWKSHAGKGRVRDKARYALVISISAPGQNVDLYSEIQTQVEVDSMLLEANP
jgi:hypothetical protein